MNYVDDMLNTSIQPKRRVVIDTTSLISYFDHVFGEESNLTKKGRSLIELALESESHIIMIVPSVVFIEIFDKWFRGTRPRNEEFRAQFYSEVFLRLQRASNIEIRELDPEVLHMFLDLEDTEINLENRDRIVLATAAVLNSELITSDREIQNYNEKYRIVPSVFC